MNEKQLAESWLEQAKSSLFHAQEVTTDGLVFLKINSSGIKVPARIYCSSRLTDYAVSTRYPGSYESVTRDEYLEAYHLAHSVVEWASLIISS